jgi:hypothetical protein
MCINNCQKVTQQCHLHTVAQKYGEIIYIFKEITNAELSKIIENIIMMDFRLNAHYPDMLSTCNDEEGYNVLERSIQGRSVELVKSLLDIGVKSYKRNVTDLIKLAIYTNKADRGELVLSYPVDTNTSLIKVIRKSNLIPEFQKSNHVDFLRIVSELQTKYSRLKGDDSGAYEDIDNVVSTLVHHYRGQLNPKAFCSPNSKQFSLVHIAAMHGLTLTLSNISTYFNDKDLLCPAYNSVTPLFLAQLLNQKAAVNMLSKSGYPRNNFGLHLKNFYFHFFLTFLKTLHRGKNVLCIFEYNNLIPRNMYKMLKALICIRKAAKTYKDRRSLSQSYHMMDLYILFQLKHTCSSICKNIVHDKDITSYQINKLNHKVNKQTFTEYAKKMDFYTKKIIVYITQQLQSNFQGELVDTAIDDFKYFKKQLRVNPTGISEYCHKFWCNRGENCEKLRESIDSVHETFDERYNFCFLRSLLRRSSFLIRVDIFVEFSYISSGTFYHIDYFKKELKSTLSSFRNKPAYNHLSEMKHMPFFQDALNLGLKLFKSRVGFYITHEIVKSLEYMNFSRKADDIKQEYEKFKQYT